MHRALLGLAAAAAIVSTAPAASQGFAAAGFGASSSGPATPGLSFRVDVHRGHGDGHHRRHRGDGFGFGWTGYNDFGDYDANRSFDPDRWNDWWHERPERAFPRWMSRNQDCARKWYSGDVLTC